MLVTLTIDPPRPPSTICLAAACVANSMLKRLISTWRRTLASGWVRNGPPRTPPALFTRMSRRPSSAWHAIDRGDESRGVHHVAGNAESPTAEPLDGSLRRFASLRDDVDHRDVAPEPREAERDPLPDTTTATGHDRDLIGEQDVGRVERGVLDVTRDIHQVVAVDHSISAHSAT